MAELYAPKRRFVQTQVRIELVDGTAAEGRLIGSPGENLAVGIGRAGVRHIAMSEIRSVMVAEPDRRVEFALAGVGILAATAALVGLAKVPIVGPYFMTHAQDGFGLVFYVGVAGLGVLLARTPLRRWLTRWRELYVAGDA